MKRLYFIFCYLYLVCSVSYGQLPDPRTQSTTNFGVVVSDYGPRHLTGHIFHNGIDYRCPRGHKTYTVDAGDITRFGGPWGGYASNIVVTSNSGEIWRYLHVESGTYLDGHNAVWEYCPDCIVGDEVINANFIILRHIVNGYLRTYSVLTTTAYNGPNTFHDSRTGDDVTISTHVDQSEWIFMPRNINGPHLHIDRGLVTG